MSSKIERTIIKNGTIIPIDETGTVYPDGAVVVKGTRIEDIGLTDRIEKQYSADRSIDASGCVVLPGLVNLHLHSGFIRGLAEDLPVFEWLTEHVDPTHRALRREEARSAYELCYAEMAKAGITCALDMYRYMEEAADVATQYGLRSVLAPYVADRKEYEGDFETLDDNLELVKSRHGDANGRIHVWFGLEHLTYCREESYYKVADYAEEYGVGIHTHGEESADMAEHLTEKHGKRPVEVLHERGILGPKTVLAHCVWLDSTEIKLIAETGTSVSHCPVSNMKLASGVAPITELLEQGVTVGLGGDGIKENNRIDLFQEMKIAALLQKLHRLDATAIPAEQALRMGTIHGARALGLEEEIGSLETGKKADLVILDVNKFHMSPVLAENDYSNIIPNVVHAAQAADVDSVMVNGELVVRNSEFLPADSGEIIDRHKAMTRQLLKRRDGG